jgi:hypothetical protein
MLSFTINTEYEPRNSRIRSSILPVIAPPPAVPVHLPPGVPQQ